MAAASLDFSIQKNLVNEKLRDMSQLAEKVRWIEQIKFKKERNHKFDKFVKRDTKWPILKYQISRVILILIKILILNMRERLT